MSEEYYYNLFDDMSWSLQSPKFAERDGFKQELERLELVGQGELYETLDFKKVEVIYTRTFEVEESGVWQDEAHVLTIESNEYLTEFEILYQIQLILNEENPLTHQDHHYFEELYLAEESIGKAVLQYHIFLGS